MPCLTTKKPILSNSFRCVIGNEQRYGIQPLELIELPVYNFNIITPNTNTRSSTKSGSYNEISNAFGHFYDAQISTYLVNDGNPPVWSNLLLGCGFVYDAEKKLYQTDPYHASNFLETIYRGFTYRMPGTRGNFVISGSAGFPVKFEYRSQGLFTPRTENSDSFDAWDEISVPLFQDADFWIKLPTNETIYPVIKEFTLSYERNINTYLNGGGTVFSDRVLLGDSYKINWNIVVEDNADISWEDYFISRAKFPAISVNIGDFLTIKNGEKTYINLDIIPTFGDTDNVRVVNLNFNMIGSQDLVFQFN